VPLGSAPGYIAEVIIYDDLPYLSTAISDGLLNFKVSPDKLP
jgi:hypothetical protein